MDSVKLEQLKRRYPFYRALRHFVESPWEAPSTGHLEAGLNALEEWPEEPSMAWAVSVP